MRPAAAPPVPGIIDTLTAGFQIVNRAPLLLAAPVLLDLAIWLGPKLSIARVGQQLLVQAAEVATQMGDQGTTVAGTPAEQIESARAALGAFNLLWLLPSLLMHTAVPLEASGSGGVLEVPTPGALALGFFGVLLVGLVVACVWMTAIAQQVREGRFEPAQLAGRIAPCFVRVIGFFLLIVLACTAIFVPLWLLALAGQLLGASVGTAFVTAAAFATWALLLWGVIYLFFSTDAIVISDAGPLRAALYSGRVVASSFWSSVVLFIITWVIMSGMGVVWTSLGRGPAGLVLSIVGNSYVESGLAAASMLFYRNRISRLLR